MQSSSLNSNTVAPPETGLAFDLRDVHRRFIHGGTPVHALQGISLSVLRGELVAVWGPSGSGKSTLLNVLGLIDRADSGRVLLDGEDVASMNDRQLTALRSRKIGFIFQSFNLIPVMSALENVMLPLQLQGMSTASARPRARQWLARVGLESRMDSRPDLLSGGQRQRVAIARALVTEPVVLIADEPTANLDSANSQSLIDLIHQLNQSAGITCIFSTHDPRLLRRIPRKLLLRDGQFVEAERQWADAC